MIVLLLLYADREGGVYSKSVAGREFHRIRCHGGETKNPKASFTRFSNGGGVAESLSSPWV
jgi:hypothetical protein